VNAHSLRLAKAAITQKVNAHSLHLAKAAITQKRYRCERAKPVRIDTVSGKIILVRLGLL